MTPRQRSTAEQVIVLLAYAVLFAIVVGTVGLVVSELVRPSEDNERLVNWLESVIDTVLGALIGFVAGRTYRNGNGGH